MNTKIRLVGIAVLMLCGLIVLTAFGQRSQRTTQTAWEYKVVYVPGNRNMSEKMMDDYGAQGWELVTFQAINNEGGTIGAGNYFFKRVKAN